MVFFKANIIYLIAGYFGATIVIMANDFRRSAPQHFNLIGNKRNTF